MSMKVTDVQDIKQCRIICFSDAAFTNLKDGCSRCVYIIFLYRDDNSFSPIPWKSTRTKRNSVETLALEQLLESCYMTRSFVSELINKDMTQNILPIKCYVANKSLLDSIFSAKTITEKML